MIDFVVMSDPDNDGDDSGCSAGSTSEIAAENSDSVPEGRDSAVESSVSMFISL
jgi:hypothetical protein